MRTSKLAIAVVFLLIATSLCAIETDASDDTVFEEPSKHTKTTIFGYVGDVSNMKNLPLDGVIVKLMDDKKQLIGTYTTDADGMFEFTYTGASATYLSFNLEGYTVRTQPSELARVEGEVNTLYFNHSEIVENIVPDEEGRYQITSTVDGGSFVAMHITTAIISGYVYTVDGDDISGAEITLRNSDGQTVTGYTNGDGYFQIECFFGTYTMSVSCGGFESPPDRTVSTDNKSVEVVMEEKSHEIFLGLDTPHAWEFLSLLMMTLTILMFIWINHRVKKGRSEIAIVNDLELEPEDEEKD